MQRQAVQLAREIQVSRCTDGHGDGQLGQQKHEAGDLRQRNRTQAIAHQQKERVTRAGTEWLAMNGAYDVRIFAQVPQESVETPEKAMQTAHDAPNAGVVPFSGLAVDVLEKCADDAANGDYQRAIGSRSQVISGRGTSLERVSSKIEGV